MNRAFKIRRFPTISDMAFLLLLFFFSQLLFGAILSLFGAVPPTVSSIEAVDVETYMNEQLALGKYAAVIYPMSMLFSLVVLWAYIRLRGGKRAIYIRHSASGFNPSIVLIGVLWLLSAQILLEPVMALLPPSEGRGIGRGVWACFTAVVSSAVLEEILCRGVIFEVFRKRWGIKTSILFSSLFFGIIHLDPATAVVAVVAGIIFGVLYVRTSSLFTSIIIHSINNAMAFAMICFGVGDMSLRDIIGEGVAYYIVYGIAAVIFIAAATESYFTIFRRQKPIADSTK